VLTPPWLRFRILTPRPIAMREGAIIDYRLSLHRVPCLWHTRIDAWAPGERFVDRQVSGPFRAWRHTHTFEEQPGGTLIRDLVVYRMPLGPLGALARRALIRRDLERIFDYRRDAIERLLVS
jgi:ligand-binding SRPBCC domain-containing protein